ncbi:MAG: antiterminator LoaP [Clostridiales bacterium]|nr:antiterminator LoaP [Clostridiales bacterium]
MEESTEDPFPGYVFLVSDDEEKLYRYLKGIPRFTRMLGTGNEVVPLNEREVVYLKQFGGKEHIAQMSEGIIEGDRVKVLMGPLKGMEAFIKKIDRHKRKAYLELELFGRTQSVEMGLEIAVKKVADEPAAEDGQKPQQDIKAKEDPAAGSDENHRKGTEDV